MPRWTILQILKQVSCVACVVFLLQCSPQSPLLPPGTDGNTDTNGDGTQTVPDELIVAARPGANAVELAELFNQNNAVVRNEVAELSLYQLGVNPSQRDSIATALSGSPLVEEVADNNYYDIQLVPNDPLYSSEWHLSTIQAPGAWDVTTGNSTIVIAVVDTGVESTHQDLAGKLRNGINLYDNTGDTADPNGHGTAVAGIIGASSNNQRGIASVTWNNPILPIRVTDTSGRTTSWLLASAIRTAVSEKAKVINLSFAPLHDDTTVRRHAQQAWLAGSLVVIATGNSNQLITSGGSDYALFVGATDANNARASFSNYGDFVSLVAPGVNVFTTARNNGYGTISGTSFAAPIVSATAGLIWSVNPNLRPGTVMTILTSTAKDLGQAGKDSTYGYGLVDAQAAVKKAAAIVEAKDTTPPDVIIQAPASQSTISNPAQITVWAADLFGVAEVLLMVDGYPLASDVTIPYAFVITPARFSSGQHTITARATDTSGNSKDSSITLNFANAPDTQKPSVSFVSPTDGSTVAGVVTLRAYAYDDRGLSSADILVDNTVISTIPLISDVQSNIAYNWNTAAFTAGTHTLTITIKDVSGNTASASIRLIVVK